MKGKRSRKRDYRGGHVPLHMGRLRSLPRSVSHGDNTYVVQHVSAAKKPYTCPGCFREVTVGTAHVVAWRDSAPFGWDTGVETRRHWHTSCWERHRRL